MARKPTKPWWREQTQCYYVRINGKQHRLDPDKKTADQMFHGLMAKPQDKLRPDDPVVIIDDFLGWCQTNRPASYDWYFQFLNPFCKAIANEQRVEPRHVSAYINKPTWGPSAKRAAITAIKRAFNWAVKEGRIEKSPVKFVEKPEATVREEVISLQEHQKLLKQANPQFRDLLEMAWETGARPFELYRLETRHLELKQSRAVFPRAESKGKKKQRVLYFSKKALAIVKRTKLSQGPILRNTDGDPWTVYSINCAFSRLQKKVGKRYCLYGYRHSFGHRKLTEGLDSMVVATLMGHTDTTMLMRVYGHIHKNRDFLLGELNK